MSVSPGHGPDVATYYRARLRVFPPREALALRFVTAFFLDAFFAADCDFFAAFLFLGTAFLAALVVLDLFLLVLDAAAACP
jgi:hypothetical protein